MYVQIHVISTYYCSTNSNTPLCILYTQSCIIIILFMYMLYVLAALWTCFLFYFTHTRLVTAKINVLHLSPNKKKV